MTSQEMRRYLAEFVEQHGRDVKLSVLVKEFKGFEPSYSPRGVTAKDPEKAKADAIGRALYSLYAELARAVVNDSLNLTDADGHVEFNELVDYFGGTVSGGTHRIPDYLVRLDDSFYNFAQDLGPNVGGRKSAPQSQGRSPNSQRLVDALKELERNNGAAAKRFLETYRELQASLKLPKLD